MYKNIKTELKNNYLYLFLTRSEQMNALDFDTFRELEDIFLKSENERLGGIVISSTNEKAFCAGADIKKMNEMEEMEAKKFSLYAQKVFNLIENSKHLVIAAVDGVAFGGGCELAMACDFIYATEDARFAQPEISLGLIPCFGGCYRLIQYIGIAKAKELILTGEIIDSKLASEFGLVNKVYKDRNEMFMAIEKLEMKQRHNSNYAIQVSKEILNQFFVSDKKSMLDAEAERFGDCFIHGDKKKGISAFLNKEKVEFD